MGNGNIVKTGDYRLALELEIMVLILQTLKRRKGK
jgi:hypothetical protein